MLRNVEWPFQAGVAVARPCIGNPGAGPSPRLNPFCGLRGLHPSGRLAPAPAPAGALPNCRPGFVQQPSLEGPPARWQRRWWPGASWHGAWACCPVWRMSWVDLFPEMSSIRSPPFPREGRGGDGTSKAMNFRRGGREQAAAQPLYAIAAGRNSEALPRSQARPRVAAARPHPAPGLCLPGRRGKQDRGRNGSVMPDVPPGAGQRARCQALQPSGPNR